MDLKELTTLCNSDLPYSAYTLRTYATQGRFKFPKPVATVGRAELYSKAELKRWHESEHKTGRRQAN